jgi:hypothetical protein
MTNLFRSPLADHFTVRHVFAKRGHETIDYSETGMQHVLNVLEREIAPYEVEEEMPLLLHPGVLSFGRALRESEGFKSIQRDWLIRDRRAHVRVQDFIHQKMGVAFPRFEGNHRTFLDREWDLAEYLGQLLTTELEKDIEE